MNAAVIVWSWVRSPKVDPWIHIGCYTARLAQSVERTTLMRVLFFFFLFVFIFFLHFLQADTFWGSLGKVGPSYVPERVWPRYEVKLHLAALSVGTSAEAPF